MQGRIRTIRFADQVGKAVVPPTSLHTVVSAQPSDIFNLRDIGQGHTNLLALAM